MEPRLYTVNYPRISDFAEAAIIPVAYDYTRFMKCPQCGERVSGAYWEHPREVVLTRHKVPDFLYTYCDNAPFVLSEKAIAAGLDPLTSPSPRPGTLRLSSKIDLEQARKFDWPDLDAPLSGTTFCQGLRDHLGVLADGTAVPCCLDHEGDLPLGNLLEQDLHEILNSPKARAIYDGFSRRQPPEELCRRCGYASRF